MTEDKTQIRDAATVIVVRDPETEPKILMGQRGAKAAFMPNKFVFPGGAVDAQDDQIALLDALNDQCHRRLNEDLRPESVADVAAPLAVAAIRELWEETGLALGSPAAWADTPPTDWSTFATAGFMPRAAPLRFVFRAITPPGRPRRFDARFFLLNARHLQGDLDDFSQASDELSHLQWIPLEDARGFDLPFITEVVLAEVAARLPSLSAPDSVPFFKNTDEAGLFKHLYGRTPTQGDLGG